MPKYLVTKGVAHTGNNASNIFIENYVTRVFKDWSLVVGLSVAKLKTKFKQSIKAIKS